MSSATHKYTGAQGADMPGNVTKATDTTSLGAGINFGFYIDKSSMTKMEALKAIEAIEYAVTADVWPN